MTLIGNQSFLGSILRTKEEAWQLLNIVQKISADTASEKTMNLKEYLDILLAIFNDTQKILVFEDVPTPNPEPSDEIGNVYDLGIALDGSMWWKDVTGWEKIWSPVRSVDIKSSTSENPSEFPVSYNGDVVYTPKGRIWQMLSGEWEIVHTPIELRITGIEDNSILEPSYGNDNDIAVDKGLKVYQKINGVWEEVFTFNSYTKEEVENILTPKSQQFVYEGNPTFQLPESTKSIYLIVVNQTPICPVIHYSMNVDKQVTITYELYEFDDVYVYYF